MLVMPVMPVVLDGRGPNSLFKSKRNRPFDNGGLGRGLPDPVCTVAESLPVAGAAAGTAAAKFPRTEWARPAIAAEKAEAIVSIQPAHLGEVGKYIFGI